jgi:acyl-homoserine lactone acylase PvdQ
MQKFIVIGSAVLLVIGFLGKNNELMGFAAVVLVGFFGVKLAWGGTKWGARTTKNAVVRKFENAKEERAYQKEQARDRAQWEEQLSRELKREQELARVRNTSQIESYKAQVSLMIEFKKQGADIDREVFAMREKLLTLEKQENSAMVQDLLSTLNAL